MQPFRWDLVTPDQLGSLLEDTPEPDLWFLDDLITCAGKVLARGGNGDLVFVGRSLDSMFDLLSGALADVEEPGVHRAALSFQRPGVATSRKWALPPLTPAEVARVREVLADAGVTPASLARGPRPVAFVDVVYQGSTFTQLFEVVRDWIEDEREPWSVIRRKLRFVGVTIRRKTSPNTERWQQEEEWPAALPARSVLNVSLDYPVWSYLGDHQVKLHRSFKPKRWFAEPEGPDHTDRTRAALAEAVALVARGRTRDVRRALARAVDGEPALAEAWLRALVVRLR